jgi:hypothetical protein
MTSEDLERRRTRLENSIDNLGWWMIGFTGLVVIGLFIELKLPFLEFIRTYNWRVFVDSLGALLVAAGVAGEFYIEFRAHRRESRLRQVNIEIEAESAMQLKEADERIATAQQRAEEAHERAANAELKAAQASLIAEQERIKRLELENQFAWRRLSFEQQLKIKVKLSSIPVGKFFVWVSPDPEAMQLMKSISGLMTLAGWTRLAPVGPIALGDFATPWVGEGLSIQVAASRNADLGPIAVAIANAITAEGIHTAPETTPDLDATPDAFRLLVGSKPQNF